MTRALTLANMPGSIQDFLFVLIREKYGEQVAASIKFNKLKQDVSEQINNMVAYIFIPS